MHQFDPESAGSADSPSQSSQIVKPFEPHGGLTVLANEAIHTALRFRQPARSRVDVFVDLADHSVRTPP